MKTAFLYPGQGAQQVGMGKDLYEAFPAARRVFDEAEEATGLPVKQLCFEGPEEALARTDVCQPAIFTVSAATLAVLGDLLSPKQLAEIGPAYMAGLSLGEYTALYAADALDLQPAARLVARRGQVMQEAAVAVPSGMVSVMGLDEAAAQQLVEAAADGQVLTCANFNCPEQIVLSGQIEACRRAEEMAKDFGARMAVPLQVAGAFHSEIMAPAARKLAEALRDVALRDPRVPVVANVDAQPYSHVEEIPTKLLDQLTSAVRWQQSMEFLLAAGVRTFFEIGPGRVLKGLMRRIDRSAEVICLTSRQGVEKAVQRLSEG
ncbi:MAG TPA: ACP S-malonyltransferase [Phycisphaerae bacterium]|nr:ACP S-malonyltransferase [Phycisphaerae bacterium]